VADHAFRTSDEREVNGAVGVASAVVASAGGTTVGEKQGRGARTVTDAGVRGQGQLTSATVQTTLHLYGYLLYMAYTEYARTIQKTVGCYDRFCCDCKLLTRPKQG